MSERCDYVSVGVEAGGTALYSIHLSSGLLGVEVEPGSRLLGGTVVICRPNRCRISSSTTIRVVRPARVSVSELRFNYLVEVRRGQGVERLVYPKKVWESVSDLLKSFTSSGRVSQQGFIFYGPPGTGKTSMAKLIAEMYGLPVVSVHPYAVLSKWLGETEKRLSSLFATAERQEPSVVLVDDGEWLLLDRALKSKEVSATTQLSVMNVVLKKIDEWGSDGRKILVLVTTNAPLEILDQALLRSGRLGRPVYIPLPDYEAVFEFLVSEGVAPEVARRWAVKAVNLGLGMADVKLDILPKLLQSVEPIVEPKSERGYRRYVVDLSGAPQRDLEVYFRALDPRGDFAEVVRQRSSRGARTVVWFAGPENVAVAVANAFLTYHAKLPSITLVDPRFAADAAEAANMLKGFLVVPGDVAQSELGKIACDLSQNVALAGKGVADAYRIDVRGIQQSVDRRAVLRGLAHIVLSFYGVSAGGQQVERLVQMALNRGEEWFLSSLNAAGFYGTSIEHLEVP